ncbi:MAG: phosphotransferase [Dehalococcoidia bacterium]|nr:phosphotransferase [Dehalococcoidia bacterium]
MTDALPSTLLPILRDALPHADIEACTPIGEGWNVTAWRLPDPGGDWAVRLPRNAAAVPEIERQTCWCRALEAEGLAVPRDARNLLGAGGQTVAGLYRYVDGAPAARSRNRGRRRDRLARDTADFVTRLHCVPPGRITACEPHTYSPWADHYGPLVSKYAPALGPAARAWVEAVGARLETASRGAPPAVPVHGDLHPAHLLVDDGGALVAVIDPSGPQVADPALEFGRLVRQYGAPFADQVLRHYGGDVDAHFAERARLYAALEPLRAVWLGMTRGRPEAATYGRRALAASAVAASRAAQ